MTTEKREDIWVAGGLGIMALTIRLVGLGVPGFSSLEVRRLLVGWSPASLFDHFSHAVEPPLYPLLSALWGVLGGGVVWMRLFPALAAAGAVAATYYLVKRKITAVTAILTCFLLIFHPLSVASAQEAGPAPLATLFIVLSAYFAAEWLATHGERAKLPTVVFAVAALYTHNYAWFYVAFLAVAALSATIRPGFAFRNAFAPPAVVVVAGLPWLPMMVRQAANGIAGLPDTTLAQTAAYVAMRLPFGVDAWLTPTFSGVWHVAGIGTGAMDAALWMMFAFLALLVLWGGMRHSFFGLMFAIGLIAAILLRPFLPNTLHDLALFAPAGAACVAAGIGELSRRTIFGRVVAAASAIVIALMALLATNDVHRNPEYNPVDWRDASALLGHSKARAREWVFVYSNESAAGFAHYAVGPWTIKPLAGFDAEALEMGPDRLAGKAEAIAPMSFRVSVLDYEGDRFDPDAEVIKRLALRLGQPEFVELSGYPKTYMILFPDQRVYDEPRPFWLTRWR